MDPSVQVLDPTIEVCLVVLPSQPINPGRRISLESKECGPKHRNTEMVEKRGEPLLPPLPCDLSYALQRLGHAFPVLRPARALLARVPLGPGPWLHQLRCQSSGVVHRLHCCRVGRGGVIALPPPARSNGSCSFPASRFPMWVALIGEGWVVFQGRGRSAARARSLR